MDGLWAPARRPPCRLMVVWPGQAPRERPRFENVGVLLLMTAQTAAMRSREEQAKCWHSSDVDEVGRVHSLQAKRGGEGHFRGD